MRTQMIGAVCAAAVLFLTSASGHAVSLGGFSCVTGNDAGNCAIGESQLQAEIVDGGDNFAWLGITNLGPEFSVVDRVFIESDSIIDALFLASTGEGVVFFLSDWDEGELPGGADPDVSFVVDDSMTQLLDHPFFGIGPHPLDPDAPQTGLFGVFYWGDFDDLLSDIRVGVSVQGFPGGGRESFVTAGGSGMPNMPEPSAAAVFAIGLLAVGGGVAARRR